MIHNPSFFASAYCTVSTCEDLTATEKSILVAIASLMRDQTETIWVAIDPTLTKLTGMNRRTVSRAINGHNGQQGLRERGYLSVEDRGTDAKTGKHRPNAYALNWALLGLENQADANVGLPQDNMSHGSEALESQNDLPRDNMSHGPRDILTLDIRNVDEVEKEERPNNSIKTRATSGVKMSHGPQDIVSGGDGLWVPSFPNAIDETPARKTLTIQPGESPMAFLRRSQQAA